MNTLVMKFGGSSTGTEDALQRAADIVCAQNIEWDQIVVVVSAMAGVTDLLIECGEHALAGDQGKVQLTIEKLHHKLSSTVSAVFSSEQPLLDLINSRLTELTHLCQRIQLQSIVSPQDLDQIAALGERINVHLFSGLLRTRGLPSEPVDAAQLIITDDRFQSASPIKSLTDPRVKTRLSPLLAEGTIPVVTGFIGSTIAGETTTLGRGGSDYTAAILAESLAADEIWIWTDVDGVMTADPGLIPEAQLIPEISYNEVFQLADSGAQVLHPKTILPAKEGNIPLYVKNTFNPHCSGTRIGQCSSFINRGVSAVTGPLDIELITFEITPDQNFPKIKSRLLAALKLHGIIPLAVFNSNHLCSISLAIPVNHAECLNQAIRESWTLNTFNRTFSRVQVADDLSLITIVGRDIYLSPKILSKVAYTLEQSGVKINRIGNGRSPDAIVLAVEHQNAWHAIQQIHDQIILIGNPGTQLAEPLLRHQPAI